MQPVKDIETDVDVHGTRLIIQKKKDEDMTAGGIMLTGSALVLAWSIARVRKVALRQVAGDVAPRPKRGKRAPKPSAAAGKADGEETVGRVRRVWGSPIIWKEFKSPLLGRRKIRAILGIIAVLAIVGESRGISWL